MLLMLVNSSANRSSLPTLFVQVVSLILLLTLLSREIDALAALGVKEAISEQQNRICYLRCEKFKLITTWLRAESQ
jgi:hypothetical protein